MSTALRAESATEDQIRNTIQAAVLREISRRRLSDDDLAHCLGLLPIGATMFRERHAWPLADAIWAAEKLGVELKVEVVSDASTD